MFDVPLYRRIVNRRGILLLGSFCVFGLALIVMLLFKYLWRESGWFDICQVTFVIASLITPIISLFKSGFSYKGHPGRRHLSLLLSGILMILQSFVAIIMNRARYFNDFFGTIDHQMMALLMCFLIPLHGIHSIVIYASFFKGPTSKFGKIYQPFVPVIE